FKKPDLNARRRRLAAALTIWDLRAIAKRRTPRAAFDYTDGAAEGELSLARARQAFADVECNPGVLRDVPEGDTRRHLLGARAPPHAASGLRLHRRCGRGRALTGPRPTGLRGRGVQPRRAAGRLRGRHQP